MSSVHSLYTKERERLFLIEGGWIEERLTESETHRHKQLSSVYKCTVDTLYTVCPGPSRGGQKPGRAGVQSQLCERQHGVRRDLCLQYGKIRQKTK